MYSGYFNHYSSVAEGYWDRRTFVRRWRVMIQGDRRWTPPYFPAFYDAVVRCRSAHLKRLHPRLIHLEALRDTRKPNKGGLPAPSSSFFEIPVGACILLCDPRRTDRTAYLGLLHMANDLPSLERTIGVALEQAGQAGYHRLIGPTGLSPHLQSGVLMDHFNLHPPLHTPYNPPYVPEIMQGALRPYRSSHLYHVDIQPSRSEDVPAVDSHVELKESIRGGLRIVSLPQNEWLQVLSPMFSTIFAETDEFPAPDDLESEFLLQWISVWPASALVAYMDEEPVGFVMLQDDLARAVARARGGLHPHWRAWLAWRARRPAKEGRLLYGGVLPDHRGKGFGLQLWQQAIRHAQSCGWRSLSIGPLSFANPAGAFLMNRGAERRQSYRLFATEI